PVAQLPVLDEPVRDVDAKAGDAPVEPEAEDPLELRPDVVVPPVEIRLLGRELVQVVRLPLLVPGPRGASGEQGPPVVRHVRRPDVVLGPLGEPAVRIRGVVRDEVEQDLEPTMLRLGDQPVEVGERAELGMHRRVVRDVVAPVDVRARMDRAEPERVDAEPAQVVELRRDAGEITDAVAVRVVERPDVDLVDDAQPIDQVSPEPTSAWRSPTPCSALRSSCAWTSSS